MSTQMTGLFASRKDELELDSVSHTSSVDCFVLVFKTILFDFGVKTTFVRESFSL